MQLLNTIKAVTPLELTLIIIFILYIIFPFNTPRGLSSAVDSPLGMVVIFCVTLFLFFYTNPILGVLYIFVAYELLRRSAEATARTAYIEYAPTQAKKDEELRAMNPPQQKTLEEEMVDMRAPMHTMQITPYVDSGFKPVADKMLDGASMV